jgi:hypothetical protein
MPRSLATLLLASLVLSPLSCLQAGVDADQTSVTNEPVQLSADTAAGDDIRRCLAPDGTPAGPLDITDDEPYAAVDPRNPDRVVAVWQSRRRGAGSVIQTAASEDGGRTWSAARAVPINECAGGTGGTGRLAGDPWVTFGQDGRAYASAITFTPGRDDGPDLVNALVAAPSSDGGRTWEPASIAAFAPDATVGHDNLATAADPTRPLSVYAATTRSEEAGSVYRGRLGFVRSLDGGKTWEAIQSITPPVDGERIGAPQLVVDPRSGRLYAVYHRARRGEAVIGVKMSEDGGGSWSDESVAAPHVRMPRAAHPVTGAAFVLADDIVQAAVSPVTGELIVAYADARLERMTISIVRSSDGRHWSAPVEASATPHSAWLPAIAWQQHGGAAIAYYEADFTSGQTDPRMRVMLRRLPASADAAPSAAPVEIASAPLAWPGDYHVLVASGDAFISVYGAQRDIFARRIGPS